MARQRKRIEEHRGNQSPSLANFQQSADIQRNRKNSVAALPEDAEMSQRNLEADFTPTQQKQLARRQSVE